MNHSPLPLNRVNFRIHSLPRICRGGVAWSFFTLVFAVFCHAEERPRVLDRDPDDQLPVITRFDVFELHDGSILYGNPKWTGDSKRPGQITDKFVQYIPFDRDRGGWGIEVKRIRKFTYWEALATRSADHYLDKKTIWAARMIVNDLEEFNPKWPSVLRLRTRLGIFEANEKIANGSIQEGVIQFASLHRAMPKDSRLETAMVDAFTKLAKDSVGGSDDDQPTEYLIKAKRAYPQNAKLSSLQLEWAEEAVELTGEAEELQHSDSGAAIEAAQRAVQLSRRTDLRERARVVIRNAEGLVVACYDKATAFEPFNATLPLEQHLCDLLYGSLLKPDLRSGELRPSSFVSKLEAKQLGQSYEIELTKSLRFSDGSAITSADLARCIEARKNPSGAAFDPTWASIIGETRLLGPRRLSVQVRPHPRPMRLFDIPVVSRHELIAFPDASQGRTLPNIFSGPYRVVLATPDGDLELVANGQSNQRPKIGKIQFRYYPPENGDQVLQDLEQGRIHLMTDPTPLQLQRLSQPTNRLVVQRLQTPMIWVLAINHESPIWGDVNNPKGANAARELRRSIALSIDRDAILRQYFNLSTESRRRQIVLSGPFPSDCLANDRSVPFRQPEPETARAIVEQHADLISKLRPVRLKYVGQGQAVEQAMTQIQESLRAIGYQVDLEKRSARQFNQELQTGSFDLAYYPIRHDSPLMDMSKWLDPTPGNGQGVIRNVMRYRNQSLTQLLGQCRSATTGAELWKAQNRVHQWCHTHVIFVPLWQLDRHIVHSPRLVSVGDDKRETKPPVGESRLFQQVGQWYLHPKR